MNHHRPIIDAGPALNFFSINRARLLVGILGQLSAPETVQEEVLRKCRQDDRFSGAAAVWRKLTPRWLEILPDDPTPELTRAVGRITGISMEQRRRNPRDLGETMVIAHAVLAAEAGHTVTVLIDDAAGARTATAEINRLARLRATGRAVGSIRLVGTLTVLERAVASGHIPDKVAMRDTYSRLRCLDDGLPPIANTDLLTSARWTSVHARSTPTWTRIPGGSRR